MCIRDRYRAAQGLRGIKVVLARPIVPPTAPVGEFLLGMSHAMKPSQSMKNLIVWHSSKGGSIADAHGRRPCVTHRPCANTKEHIMCKCKGARHGSVAGRTGILEVMSCHHGVHLSCQTGSGACSLAFPLLHCNCRSMPVHCCLNTHARHSQQK